MNQGIILYHGTNSVAVQNISSTGRFDLEECRTDTDFGRGMYTTTNERQAKKWAIRSALRVQLTSAEDFVMPHVMRFLVPSEEMAALQSLFFVRPTSEYWLLVRHCRKSNDHSRVMVASRWYDVVAGPVANTDLRSTRRGYDQLSFHTPEACAILYNSSIEGIYHDAI